jgi:c-di-GMP-binding flagellar brake protein YcgR
MILLQYSLQSLKGGEYSGPGLYLYFGIAVAVVVVLILVGSIIARRNRPRTAADNAQYSSTQFKKAGKALGLTPAQVDLLENLVRLCKVKQPFLVFTSAGLLDDTLKKGLYSLDSSRGLSEEEREKRRSLIFQIKQTVERNARKGAALGSTNYLKPGQPLTITPEGSNPFASKVISNMKDFLTVAAHARPAGADTRWMRGTLLSVYLWRENDAGYSFPSKILGYDTVKGVPSVLIQHAKTLRREQRRRSRRRELVRPCFYYPITITETGEGRKAERKAVVERDKRTLGTVVDLSAGGCAVQTLNPFEKGRLVMIEFDIDRRAPIRAFGKVMHTSRRAGRGGGMNIMFTRVTSQYLNRISEFVYDFSRPATVAQVRQQMDRAVPGRGEARPTAQR